MSVLLSIVMPSLIQRMDEFDLSEPSMYQQIREQISGRDDVEFFCLMDNGPLSTGGKVRLLFALCRGQYICRVDDDDRVEPDYVDTLVKAIRHNPGVDVITFEHTYNHLGEYLALTKQIVGCEERQLSRAPGATHEVHHRLPSHLCPVRAEIAKSFTHPSISDGEDEAYRFFLKDRLETHYAIDRVLYHHNWNYDNKRERNELKRQWGRK